MIAVDAATIAALSAAKVRLAMFVELALDAGSRRYVTAQPDIAWNGFTWLGGGRIVSMQPLAESAGLEALGWEITLAGTDSAMVSDAAQTVMVGRRASVWVGCYDEAGALVSTPFLRMQGAINDMTIVDTDATATIVLRIESRLIWMLKARSTYWTNAEQKRRYPTDDGFKFTDITSQRTLKFGPRQ
ncbi:MAG: hypothetical protein RJA99_4241 [Pseudomonadota bacterium]